MSATLSTIAALVLFVLTLLPVRADKIDTEHLLGEGNRGAVNGTVRQARFYTGFSQVFSAELTPAEKPLFGAERRVHVSRHFWRHRPSDWRRGAWQAL
jgi:hypothetical protein